MSNIENTGSLAGFQSLLIFRHLSESMHLGVLFTAHCPLPLATALWCTCVPCKAKMQLQSIVLTWLPVRLRGMGLIAWSHSFQGPPAQTSSPSSLLPQHLLCSLPGRPTQQSGMSTWNISNHMVSKACQLKNLSSQQLENRWEQREWCFCTFCFI